MPTLRRANYKNLVIPLTAEQRAVIARKARAAFKTQSGYVKDALAEALREKVPFKSEYPHARLGSAGTQSIYVEIPLVLYNELAAHISAPRTILVARYALQVACGL